MNIARLLPAVLCIAWSSTAWSETLVVHEWGTFTSFQDASGRAIGGINVDDEPVPAFVHDVAPGYLAALDNRPRLIMDKGWPARDPQVTMRLETPVLYFHPAPGSGPLAVDVRVDFHGGWLTQFYPDAVARIPSVTDAKGRVSFAPLSADAIGTLRWPEVRIGGAANAPPQTTAPVWLAPRRVQAAPLSVGTEGEGYLFYRGIGHLDAPVRVERTGEGHLFIHPGVEINQATDYWLVDIRADGGLAYRCVSDAYTGQVPIDAGPDAFRAEEYASGARAELRRHLLAELGSHGLFADEAAAMLDTWDASYFRNPGLRLFFLAPRPWTDRVLPLALSRPAVVERVMVGRIELVSPSQRAALDAIAAGPRSDQRWWSGFLDQRVYDPRYPDQGIYRDHGLDVLEQVGRDPGAFARLGVAVPGDYRTYLSLGRFREALLHQALADHPAPGLVAFAKAYGLR